MGAGPVVGLALHDRVARAWKDLNEEEDGAGSEPLEDAKSDNGPPGDGGVLGNGSLRRKTHHTSASNATVSSFAPNRTANRSRGLE
jgi:hypothetical protein